MLNGWLSGESLSSATRHVCRKSIDLLDDRQKQKWIWVILLALAAYESYFVRALLAALFFLTILYVVLAPLPTLYSFIAHAFYCGILWTAMVGDSFHSLCGFGPSAYTVQFHSPRFLLYSVGRGAKTT